MARCAGYLSWLRASWKEKNLYTAMDENEQLILRQNIERERERHFLTVPLPVGRDLEVKFRPLIFSKLNSDKGVPVPVHF